MATYANGRRKFKGAPTSMTNRLSALSPLSQANPLQPAEAMSPTQRVQQSGVNSTAAVLQAE